MSVAKQISKNFISLFVGNILSQVLMFIAIISVANTISTDDFGKFSFAQAFALFFTKLSECGLDTAGVRAVAIQKTGDRLVGDILVIRGVLTALAIAIAAVLSWLMPVPDDMRITMLICLISVGGMSFSLEWYFQGKERMHIVGLTRTLRALFFFLPVMFLGTGMSNDHDIAWVYSVSFILTSVFLLVLVLRFETVDFSFSLERIRRLLKENYTIGIAIVLMQIPFHFNTLFIGISVDANAVGIFSAGYRITLVIWGFGIVAAYNAFFPTMSALAEDREGFERLCMKLTSLFAFGSGLMVLTMYVLAPQIIGLLYAEKFPGAVFVLRASVLIVSVIMMRTAVEYSLLALKKNDVYLRGMIMVSCLYVVCGAAGFHLFGIPGIMAGSAVAEVLYTIFLFRQFDFPVIRRVLLQLLGRSYIILALVMVPYYFVADADGWMIFPLMLAVFVVLSAWWEVFDVRNLRSIV